MWLRLEPENRGVFRQRCPDDTRCWSTTHARIRGPGCKPYASLPVRFKLFMRPIKVLPPGKSKQQPVSPGPRTLLSAPILSWILPGVVKGMCVGERGGSSCLFAANSLVFSARVGPPPTHPHLRGSVGSTLIPLLSPPSHLCVRGGRTHLYCIHYEPRHVFSRVRFLCVHSHRTSPTPPPACRRIGGESLPGEPRGFCPILKPICFHFSEI